MTLYEVTHMNKYLFEDWLRNRLADLPPEELERVIADLLADIDDRMEDGMTEEQAIHDLGEPEALLAGIRASLPERVTYEPVRQPLKKGSHGRRWVALLLAAAAIGIALPVLWAAVRFPRRTPEPLFDQAVQEVTIYGDAVSPYEADGWQVFDARDISRICVDQALGDVSVSLSGDGRIHVYGDCIPEQADGVLSLSSNQSGALWSDMAGSPITLELPMTGYVLNIYNDCGATEITGIYPDTLIVKSGVGDISLWDVYAKEAIHLTCDVGSIYGTLLGSAENYSIKSSVDLGSNSLSAWTGGGKVLLEVTVDVGDIDLEFSE